MGSLFDHGIKDACERVVKSYGGMTVCMNFLKPIEQLQMQCVNKWWYEVGIGRVQVRIKLVKIWETFFFASKSDIYAETASKRINPVKLKENQTSNTRAGTSESKLDNTNFSKLMTPQLSAECLKSCLR